MTFSVRPASEAKGDIQFILDAHDSSLTYLASIGSDQWGTEPFSQRKAASATIANLVRQSEAQSTGQDYLRTFIAEKAVKAAVSASHPAGKDEDDDDDQDGSTHPPIRCAAATIEAKFPAYVLEAGSGLEPLFQGPREANDFLYLDRLVSDRSVGAASKGAGKRLLDHCKALCRQQGKRFLFSDCFAGPPNGLQEYYRAQGFDVLGKFIVPGKHSQDTEWRGVLLCCDVTRQGIAA